MHGHLGRLGELDRASDHERVRLEHDVAPDHLHDLVRWRRLGLDGADTPDQGLAEQPLRHPVQGHGAWYQRLRAHVAQVKHRLRIVDRVSQPPADLELGSDALRRRQDVDLAPGDRGGEPARGLHRGQDNAARPLFT